MPITPSVSESSDTMPRFIEGEAQPYLESEPSNDTQTLPTVVKVPPNPDDDGVTHINVYSKGRTELGQLLSNFSETPFKHEKYGHFASMEGYWYYIKTGCCHDELRRLYGASAKGRGVKYDPVQMDEADFKCLIFEGLTAKVRQNRYLRELLTKSELPLLHYFVYGSKVVELPQHQWQLDHLEELRRTLKHETV